MRLFALSVVAALSVPLAAVADEAAEKELKRFQGDWQVVSASFQGQTKKGDDVKGKVWRFEGKMLIPLDNKNDVAVVTIDPAKQPATLDIQGKNEKALKGIYKFAGDDKLTICAGVFDDKRPEKFDSPKDSGAILFELERVKK